MTKSIAGDSQAVKKMMSLICQDEYAGEIRTIEINIIAAKR
jgi:hypothetical protein